MCVCMCVCVFMFAHAYAFMCAWACTCVFFVFISITEAWGLVLPGLVSGHVHPSSLKPFSFFQQNVSTRAWPMATARCGMMAATSSVNVLMRLVVSTDARTGESPFKVLTTFIVCCSPEGRPGMSDVSPRLESQGCHLIPLCYLLSCSSA